MDQRVLTASNDYLDHAARSDSQIVIRAAALITCLGTDRIAVWRAVKSGCCGIAPLTEIESVLPPGADGGQAPNAADADQTDGPREVGYLRRAIKQVLREAGFGVEGAGGQFQLTYPNHRCAVVLGTTLHGMRQGGAFLRTNDARNLGHFLAASVIRAASRELGLEGPALTTCSACSSSLSAIALGITLLQSGQADLVVAGGYDPISEYAYAGFNSLRLIAPTPLRSFARDRRGMKVGEGYGLVILERSDDAHRRGGTTLAGILGYGESSDAHHLTQPHPQGAGAARAITAALKDAQLTPADIHLVAAHATGTPDNDAAEYAALSSVFGPNLANVPVVAFKTHLSHTLGGAGAVELILSAMAMAEQIVPPCANVGPSDTDFPDLRIAGGSARPATINATMNLSLGFGGANTCMILGRGDIAQPPRPPAVSSGDSQTHPFGKRDVLITGIGVLMPGEIGNEAFLARVIAQDSPRVSTDATAFDEESLSTILSARRIRRMSGYVKLSLASAMLALRDAGVSELPEFLENCSGLLGTAHGAALYCAEYYQGIIRDGIGAANPMLFAEGVPNAAAAHLSMATGMKGSCQTIIGSRTSGLDALGLAAARIASGRWERAVVVAADEYSPLVNSGYAHCGLYAPSEPAEPFSSGGTFVTGWGAAALVLESRQSFAGRGGAQVHGAIDGYSAGAGDAEHLARTTDRVLAELSDPQAVMSSANGTWLDRAEAGALRRSSQRTGRLPLVSSLCGHIAECFSAVPLASIVAVLLGGRLPRLYGSPPRTMPDIPIEHFTALATDISGLAAGVRVIRGVPATINRGVGR